MGCSLTSSTKVDSQVYTSNCPVNRAEAPSPSSVNAANRDSANREVPSPVSLYNPVAPVVEAVREPVDEAIRELDRRDAQEPAIQDIRGKYDLGNLIGTGRFAQVRIVTLKEGSGDVRAVKIYERTSSEDAPGRQNKVQMFETEVQILHRVSSEHIIHMYDFYEDPHFNYIVMDMCSGGRVLTRLVEQSSFTEKTAGFLGKQMLLAIEHIHSLYIVHRDIKAESFMLSGPRMTSPLKLIDFKFSCEFEDGVYMTELFGSPDYMAPELIGQRYTHLIDVWAFGVLMYLLLYGHFPFEAPSIQGLMLKILSEPIPWHTNSGPSQACLNFLSIVLERYAKRRAAASECLQQEWIQAPARAGIHETIEISSETNRSDIRHLTDTHKQIDPKIRERSGRKLREMDANWKKQIMNGLCSAVKDKDGQMDHTERPELLRRANKLVSAPSRQQGSKPSEERSDVRAASAVDGKRLAEMYELTTRDADEMRRFHREKLDKEEKAAAGTENTFLPSQRGLVS